MAKWHYKYVDEINGKKYLTYDADVIEKLRDRKYAIEHDSFDEWSYIADYYPDRLLSFDNKLVYIPDANTAFEFDMMRAEWENEVFDEDW